MLPLINLVFLFVLAAIPGLGDFVSFDLVAASTLMWATPAATVAVGFCLSSGKDDVFASSCSLISTLTAVVLIPVWMVVLTVIQTMAIFV